MTVGEGEIEALLEALDRGRQAWIDGTVGSRGPVTGRTIRSEVDAHLG